jgi:hypothetical protein
MALPSSGALSLADIQGEFGGANPISLSEYYAGGGLVPAGTSGTYGAVPSSGTISIQNFYGTSNAFTFGINSSITNANLRTLAVNAGWNQSVPLVAVIGSGVYITSTSTGTPALTVNGSFPGGVTLTNNGAIVGMGGNGGRGWGLDAQSSNGLGGGTAIAVSVAITIANNGTFAGGGGGGGGGGMQFVSVPGCCGYSGYYGGGGGGGGASSFTNSSGGAGGSGDLDSGSPGGTGTFNSAGSGGSSTYYSGGNGGAWGSSGGDGGGIGTFYTGQAGGSAGYSVTGNGNISWSAFGTRTGPIS